MSTESVSFAGMLWTVQVRINGLIEVTAYGKSQKIVGRASGWEREDVVTSIKAACYFMGIDTLPEYFAFCTSIDTVIRKLQSLN